VDSTNLTRTLFPTQERKHHLSQLAFDASGGCSCAGQRL